MNDHSPAAPPMPPFVVEGQESDGAAFRREFPTIYDAYAEAQRVMAGGGWAEITPPPIQ